MNHLQQEAVADLLIPLRGAAASIILALVLFGGSLTAKELEVVTGYSDKPVTKALAYLERKRYVQSNGQLMGWSVRQGSQLPLSGLFLTADNKKLSTGYPQIEAEDRNFSDLHAPPPPNIEGTPKMTHFKAAEGGKRREDRNFSDLSPEQQIVFDLCRQKNTSVKKAYELAGLDWCTPEYVTAIFREYQSRDDLTARNKVAYAIQAISDGDEPAAAADSCPDCGRAVNPRLGFCTSCVVER